MASLQVYVSDGCWACGEARRVAADISHDFPQIAVELIDADPQDWPSDVFAVPTYLLDGRVLFLGNPSRRELHLKLAAAGIATPR